MCGIAGIFSYHYAANPVDPVELNRIREHMKPRGPDGAGTWISADQRIGLASRRLAIIDLTDRAAQPFVSEDGRYVLVFNGEIYNYKALRAELEARGARFRSDSDTEVILQLFIREGVAMLPKLRGMFGLGIWDGLERRLLLARDPYGIKPLYYADDGWTVRFASQVKSLLAGGKVSRDPEPAGVVGFYLLGSVPEPFTSYQEIRAVPAGSCMWITSIGAQAPAQYFSVAQSWADSLASPRSRGEAGALCASGEGQIRSALLDSVRHHLVADVPVGAFLSSGVDSGALVGLMRDAGQQQIKTVTVAFNEFEGREEDEAPLAAETARTYGTDHHTRRVTRAEFLGDLPRILEAMDQPSIDGINTWFVAKATAEQGLKVAISGLGGDELFGGYPSFRDIPRWVSLLAAPSRVPGAGRLFRALASALLPGANPKLGSLLEFGGSYGGAWFVKRGLFMPSELSAVLDAELVREGLRRLRLQPHLAGLLSPDPGTPFGRVATLESAMYMRNQLLRDTDWASMAHSLEVRVPLVDSVLLAAVAMSSRATRGGSLNKLLLANSPATALPSAVTGRAKTGFSIPVAQWLQGHRDLAQWRKVPALTKANCPWARRWAHVIGSRFAEVA